MSKLISVTARAVKHGTLGPPTLYSSVAHTINDAQIVNAIPCICKVGEGVTNPLIFDPAINSKFEVNSADGGGQKITYWVTETVAQILAKDA